MRAFRIACCSPRPDGPDEVVSCRIAAHASTAKIIIVSVRSMPGLLSSDRGGYSAPEQTCAWITHARGGSYWKSDAVAAFAAARNAVER
jgi:hypothetical protein